MATTAIPGFGGAELHFASWVKGRAVTLLQFGFVVKRVDLAHSAGAEYLYDTFCLGLVVRLARGFLVQHG